MDHDINAVIDHYGNTALIFAIKQGSLIATKELLDKSADPDIKNSLGETALMMASAFNELDLVIILLDHGADASITNKGYSAFTIAVERNHLEIAEELLKRGQDPNKVIEYVYTSYVDDDWDPDPDYDPDLDTYSAKFKSFIYKTYPLIRAASKGYLDLVKLLLRYRADPNVLDKDHNTTLIKAVEIMEYDMTKELINASANLNVQSSTEGVTALMIAKGNDDLDLFKLLLQKGADISIIDFRGRDVCTTEYGQNKQIDILLNRYRYVPLLNHRLIRSESEGLTRDLYSLIEKTLH
jgi:ankyrin repeat protein